MNQGNVVKSKEELKKERARREHERREKMDPEMEKFGEFKPPKRMKRNRMILFLMTQKTTVL